MAQRLGLTWFAHLLPGLATAERLLPRVPSKFLVPRGEVYASEPTEAPPRAVAFFAGCVMSTALTPPVGMPPHAGLDVG